MLRRQLSAATRGGMKVCIYCGAAADTVDHVPPRSFLERPFPPNLATVPACRSCNQGFSLDEAYALVLIAQIGTSEALLAKVDEGGQVDRALRRAPRLEQRLLDRMEVDESGGIRLEPERDRLALVFKKIASGLHWLRYGRTVKLSEFGPVGFWPVNIEDHLPPEIAAANYTERFKPKRWTTVQEAVFSYIFVELMDGRLACVFRIHETVWAACVVPRPARGKSRYRTPAQDQLSFPEPPS